LGITIEMSDRTLIANNNLDNKAGPDLMLYHSRNAVLTNNTFYGSGIAIDGSLEQHFLHSIDDSNTKNNRAIHYIREAHDLEVSSEVGQVIVASSNDIRITNLDIEGAFVAISVYYSSNVDIVHNQITNNSWGVLSLQSPEGDPDDSQRPPERCRGLSFPPTAAAW
jgi:hypothetical protein